MTNIDKSIIQKWQPVIENLFNFRNKILTEHICNYCEYYSLSYYNAENANNLTDKLNEVKYKIDNSKRVGIVRNVFNVFTGIEEYELSNGRYVPVNSSFSYELSTDELIEVLGLEYMKFYDPIEFRDKQIDKIIL
jgi:hypothetical protein